MGNIKTSKKSFIIKGNIINEEGTTRLQYSNIFVSNGTIESVKVVSSDTKEDSRASTRTDTLEVILNLSRHSCVIEEEYLELTTGEIIAKRKLLYGHYRKQKMIDVRKYYKDNMIIPAYIIPAVIVDKEKIKEA